MAKASAARNGAEPHGEKKPAGCYVLSLEVENVRCFGPKQTLDCSDGEGRPRQWTVILGDNGTGKTTLLQALACHEWMDKSDDNIFKGEALILQMFPGFLSRSTPQRHGKSHLSACIQATIRESSGTACLGSWDILSDSTATFSSVLHSLVLCGYGPNRGAFVRNEESGMAETPSDDATSSLFLGGSRLRDAEKLLINLDYASKSDDGGTQKEILDRVEEVLLNVLPGITALNYEPGTGYFPRPRVEFKSDYGWVPHRQLGHGYQTMIAWVVDFVSRMVERYPESENPFAEPAVCLVDEIDLHLHPVWQRKVIGYLSERFPNTQFIVTAHSPLVVQAAASANANIAVLVRSTEKDTDGNHYVEIKNNPEDVRNWRLDQILTSDLFGMSSARPVEVEQLFARKHALLAKAKLTKTEQGELADIEKQLRELPFGETRPDMKAMDEVRQTLEMLKKKLAP